MRKSKTVNGTTTYFVRAGSKEVYEYDGSGAMLRRYVPNNAVASSGTRTTDVSDIQGSTIASIDGATGTISKFGYLPFGETNNITGSFRYGGERIDAETNGLYYLRARMYSPALGRFLQPDPIGYGGGANLYAYVGNDPLNAIDPTGLSRERVGTGDAEQNSNQRYSNFTPDEGTEATSAQVARPGFVPPGAAAPGGARDQYGVSTSERALANWLSSIFSLSPLIDAVTDFFNGEGASSYRDRGLIAAGIVPGSATSKNYDVHHIVAANADAAQPARDVLALPEINIGIHDTINLVALPREQHQSMHNQAYYDNVNNQVLLGSLGGRAGVAAVLLKFQVTLSRPGL